MPVIRWYCLVWRFCNGHNEYVNSSHNHQDHNDDDCNYDNSHNHYYYDPNHNTHYCNDDHNHNNHNHHNDHNNNKHNNHNNNHECNNVNDDHSLDNRKHGHHDSICCCVRQVHRLEKLHLDGWCMLPDVKGHVPRIRRHKYCLVWRFL
eukprot:TRINITY_DN13962_c0_g1_i5.p3 TRINITY_DN13962_c0_g1~~TRINITY_DN13962_c0_g1_i5.p3  ORF type:complete len:148 (+),score=35.75 TRINITY_DN13962_c0_g1_i5:257-700(+)